MTVTSQKKSIFVLYLKKKFLPLLIILNNDYMSTYISSATVIFITKSAGKSAGEKKLSSATVYIDVHSGCTLLHATDFLYKNPIVKYNLQSCNILSITFNYSEL